jgi:hypothetical protein
VVVGYRAPDHGLSWEEFILATPAKAGTSALPQPTGDAVTWARALAPGDAPPELEKEAARYRKRIHRRLALSFWGLAALTVTVAYVVLPGLLALGIALEGKPGDALGILAVAGAIGLATILRCGLIIRAVIR